ncbi:two-component system sensor histidine kinase YesM [Paenibacillus endophyticus]|uniref:Two-component system sensor histidine kinase YesM n=1 Tax=Paenibacillus endophyticus TaxID=1294268 RepID=A0A7W5GCA5_9BACL|nr:histidine kinase [Paenibacillus endophyticus]MBB3153822.1 two-component system sensor histidine kinase YesM [Paenibacillus endophyticus]
MRRRISLPLKLFFIVFAFVLGCIILISQLSYRYVQKEIRTNDIYYTNQILDKVDQYFTVNFASFQTILFSVETSVNANIDKTEVIKEQLRELYELNSNYVSNIYLINRDLSIVGGSTPTRIFDEPLAERQPLFVAADKNRRTTFVSDPYKSKYSGWTVTMVRYLNGAPYPMAIAVDLDLNAIEETLFKINKQEQMNLALITASGKIIAGFSENRGPLTVQDHTFSIGETPAEQILDTTETSLQLHTKDGLPVSLLKKPTEKFNWTIISVNDESRLKAALTRLETYYIALLAAGLILSLFISFLIAKYIRNPLYALKTKMKRVEQGILTTTITINRDDEFGDLSRAFDRMLQQIVELIQRAELHNELERKLEIQVLQSQINPHFLYNTLGSISNVIRLGQIEKVDVVIGSLISLLEYGIDDASEKVSLRQELRNVADYIEIQNIRYNRNFQLIENIEAGLMDFPVFRMLLQPLVENSIFHGYNGGGIEGPITIHAYKDGGIVIIEVVDQGEGIPADKINRILISEPGDMEVKRKRIGLTNIHGRIRLHYGEQFGLQIISIPKETTRIRALFPSAMLKGDASW